MIKTSSKILKVSTIPSADLPKPGPNQRPGVSTDHYLHYTLHQGGKPILTSFNT